MIKKALQVEPVTMKFEHYCEFIRKWGTKAVYLEYFDGALQSRAIPEYPKEINYEEPCLTAVWEAVNTVLCGIASKFKFTNHEYLRVKIDGEDKVLCPHLALSEPDGSYVFIEVAEPLTTVTSNMEGALYRLGEYIKCFPGSRGYAITITEGLEDALLEVTVSEKGSIDSRQAVGIMIGSTIIPQTEIECMAQMGITQFYLKWLRSYSTEDEDYATMEAELCKHKVVTNTKLQRISRELKACINQKISDDEASLVTIPGLFGMALCEVVEGVDKVVATKAYRATGGISRLVENNIMPIMLDKVKPLQKVCQRLAKMNLE